MTKRRFSFFWMISSHITLMICSLSNFQFTQTFVFFVTIITNTYKLNFIFDISKFELSQKRFIVEFFEIQIQRSYLLFVVKIDNNFRLRRKKIDFFQNIKKSQRFLMIFWNVQYLWIRSIIYFCSLIKNHDWCHNVSYL